MTIEFSLILEPPKLKDEDIFSEPENFYGLLLSE